MKEAQGSMTQQTIFNGSPQQLNTLIFLLCVLCALASATLALQLVNRDDARDLEKEVRILQMHTQDQNAILIRAGLIRAGDLSLGPTNPTQLEPAP